MGLTKKTDAWIDASFKQVWLRAPVTTSSRRLRSDTRAERDSRRLLRTPTRDALSSMGFTRLIQGLFFAIDETNVRNVCCNYFALRRRSRTPGVVPEMSTVQALNMIPTLANTSSLKSLAKPLQSSQVLLAWTVFRMREAT